MAKKKKGPRAAVGLKCSVCGKFNYITEKNSRTMQEKGKKKLELHKYCKVCRKATKHVESKKLK